MQLLRPWIVGWDLLMKKPKADREPIRIRAMAAEAVKRKRADARAHVLRRRQPNRAALQGLHRSHWM